MTLVDLLPSGATPDTLGEAMGGLDELRTRPAWMTSAACRSQGTAALFIHVAR